jgi:lysophospholipase L1-like esterase
VPLPLCNVGTRWAIAERPERGSARIRGGKLVYRAPKSFRGTASITLTGRAAPGASASVTPAGAVAPVQITVGSPEAPVVRALGDSVTAGFGYYDDGSLMGFTSLLSCKPGAKTYDDACSSNSTVRTNKAEKVEYSADYGLANNVSWVAQWANAHGVTNFKNYAVSGSEPSDWFGKGQFAATTKQLASEKPDYVLMTIGANPLLSNMLFGIGNIGCGIWADAFGRFQECIEEEFAEINLRANLKTLYTNLVKETKAQIFVMQYHLSIPTAALYTATQIAEMGNLLNEEVSTVAKEVSASRITVVAPPHFNTGLDIAPAYPAEFKCVGRFFSSHVDGRSVQSSASQTLLQGLHPFEFCPQPAKEKPWVISGDTGIHPSAEGYAHMAAEVPAPK